jgi:hypothetical protein
MKKTISILAAGSLALALAACSGPKTDEAPVETNVMNFAEPENAMIANEIAPTPAPASNVAAAPAARGADFEDGAQTQDDADATGMTARVSRDGDNETAPTQ